MIFREALLAADQANPSETCISIAEGMNSLALDGVAVRLANREISLDVPSLEIQPGERVLAGR
jgi:hypothetical protein